MSQTWAARELPERSLQLCAVSFWSFEPGPIQGMNLEKSSLASCVNGSGEVVISQLEGSEPGAFAGGYLRL